MPYDVVLDCDQNGVLSDGDFIDGMSYEAGLYMVHDTTAVGPHAVTEQIYNLDAGVAASFSIPGTSWARTSTSRPTSPAWAGCPS